MLITSAGPNFAGAQVFVPVYYAYLDIQVPVFGYSSKLTNTGPDKKPVTFWAIRSKQIINSTTFKVIIGLGWAQGGRGWVPEATLRPNMYVFGYFWGLITY